jgi:hypothetical protein
MLWLKTVGAAASTVASARRSPLKSGVSTSTPACGSARLTASTVAAKCAAPPSSRSSRFTEVSTT